jgi:hypothetical protein
LFQQWLDMLLGNLMLVSLAAYRNCSADPFQRNIVLANLRGTRPYRKDGAGGLKLVKE